ncbi:hypothetical protein DW019_11145 [Clostridium sp. AF37-5]|jgi:hypothetical protein|uniref:hypothetical protein n=1 Tax=Clostridium sp. AF37-5 TaxID=2293016 RepID=UPI000E537A80|nr:hypothetical protein [Clostridium sp. AF37-5]RHO95800.1 hypothetical protein DW019_11145 [Clostridium sp. AF37-5]
MTKFCISLKELLDNGIQYLEFGGYIKLTNEEDGYCCYELYKDDSNEEELLLSDGEQLSFGKWKTAENGIKYIIGTSGYGKQVYLTKREFNIAVLMMDLGAKFNLICKPIPTYALSDEIGIDIETSYILDLTAKKNYKIANEYLKTICPDYKKINKKYIGNKVIVEFYRDGYGKWWFCNHGTIKQYFKAARVTLERYMKEL